MKWSVMWNAAEKPRKIITEMMLLNFANRKLLKPFVRAVLAECWDQTLDVAHLEVNVTRGSIINRECISPYWLNSEVGR